MANHQPYIDFFLEVCDFAAQGHLVSLRESVRCLLKLLPTGMCTHPFIIILNQPHPFIIILNEPHPFDHRSTVIEQYSRVLS